MTVDLSRLAFFVGLAALLLAIPLSVAANLLTPHVKDWLSRRNDDRRGRRIEKLQNELTSAEKQWTFTKSEELIYRNLQTNGQLIILFAHCVYGVLLTAALSFRNVLLTATLQPHDVYGIMR